MSLALPTTSPRRALRLDRSRQAAPQVFERLREMIVSLELVPGSVLSRADLTAWFGVSQTPIRDALLKLSEEGLVDIFPQHATVVSRIDVASARQAHFLRLSIELEVVRTLAASPSAPLVARLRAQIELQTALQAREAYAEFIVADQAFHRLMYEAAGVSDLFDLVRRRSGHVDRLRRLDLPSTGKTRAVVRDHRKVIDAIERGDVDAATQALRDHLSGTLQKIDQIVARHPEYLAA
ncbi:MAG TPA: GntR family transcriptional regulator [Burkholderiaceae bacterium]|nr:GntR family transcriptional regulator [Burkholderiaceae bacterium]